jgi:hypothetical protein
MVLLQFRITLIFILLVFTLICLKMASVWCVSALDFSHEQDLPRNSSSCVVLELRRSSSPELHFHGGKVRLLQESPEKTALVEF